MFRQPDLPDGVLPALAYPNTRQAVRRRGRAIGKRAGLCALAVMVLGTFLIEISSPFWGWVFVMVDAVFFGLFIGAMWSYIGLIRMRRIIRLNPWVEWFAKISSVEVRGHEVAREVALAHPDWVNVEVRVLHPRRLADDLPPGRSMTVWAAGNPAKTMVISPVEGGAPLRGSRPHLLLRKLTSRKNTS